MSDLLFGDGTIEAAGAVVLFLLAFFFLLVVALIPLFGGALIRYTFRTIRRRFSEGKL